MPPLLPTEFAAKHPNLVWLYFRSYSILHSDTKAVEILSGVWFILIALYLFLQPGDELHDMLKPALDSIAPRHAWVLTLAVFGFYQIGATFYNKTWCRKLASLFASSLWIGVVVGVYYLAGNVPSVGLLVTMVLSLSIAALGLYDENPRLDS